MFKYAFIFSSETLTPETCSKEYENGQFYCKVAAVNSMEICLDLAKKLADGGVQILNLCGDFDEEKAEAVRKATSGRLEVCFVKYTEEEKARVEALPSLSEYGIIIKAPGVGQTPVKIELKSNEGNTYVAFVADDSMAYDAANEMVRSGIFFIELGNSFTKEKAEKVAEFIGCQVPIGYSG